MAKDTIKWGAGDAPAEAIKWGESDAPADASAAAPAAAPVPAAEVEPAAPAGDPMGGGGAEIMAAAQPKRESVLEGVQMPAPAFDPAQGERLSLRRNAEADALAQANAGRASMRPAPAGPQARPTGEGMVGRAGDLIKAQTFNAASGLARGAADVAGAVGAEDVAADLNARASAATEKNRQLSQGVELEQAARRFETVSGFAPGSVVQDGNRFANEYLPQILAQGQQVPMALFGGLTPLVGISYLSSYADARDAGKSPAEALAYAVPQSAAEYIGEKAGGMGRLSAAFEKAVSSGFARDAAWRNLGKAFLAAGAKEVPSEELTYGLQFINDKFSPVGLQPNATWEDFKKGAADTAIVAMGSGGAMAGAGALVTGRRPEPQQATADQLARSKGFLSPGLDQVAMTQRIARLREAGDTAVADHLQRQLDRQSADGELAALQLPAAQTPAFQDTYRGLRAGGMKPAEAAARSAVVTDFRDTAAAAGMSEKAIAAAVEASQKKGLDELPGFLHRFTQSLASRGAAQAVDIGPQLEAARDAGITAAAESLYGDVKPVMDAAQALEAQQAAPERTAAAKPAEAANAPVFETGNDIAVTPEADAVHAAATSPLNDLPEPTQAQKDAGNYKVGRVRIAGMDISVENPQGSVRRGTDQDGKPWETPMRHHYGYFRGTTATDGDKLDVFVVPGTPEDYRGPVFVVDQIDPKTGKLDEHKVILGARDEAEAEAIYRSNYSADWQGLGAITRLPLPAFKAWAATGNKKEALGDIKIQAQQTPQTAQTAAPAAAADEAPAAGDGTQRGEQGTVQPGRAVDDGTVADQPDAVEPAAEPAQPIQDPGGGRKLAALRNGNGKFQAVDDSGNIIPSSPEFDTGPEADHWRRQQIQKAAPQEPAVPAKKPTAREAAAAAEKQRENEKRARRKEAAAKASKLIDGLSVGTLPSNAEPVSVREGVVYIGKHAAQNFDTGKDVTVPEGATQQQIMEAVKEAGALGKRSRFFTAEEQKALARGAPVWRSALRDGIDTINAKALTPTMWADGIKGLMNKGAVKADEVEWSGLNDWLQMQTGKVTKEQVLGYLDGNGVQIEEVILTGDERALQEDPQVEERDDGNWAVIDPDTGEQVGGDYRTEDDARAAVADMVERSDGAAKYGNYTLPGGENYREVLLTLPAKDTITEKKVTVPNGWGDTEGGNVGVERIGDTRSDYRSSHFETPNVLAHIRVNDRVDADGRKTLFIEEIQSDFGQDFKKQKDAINKAVDDDFEGIIARMKKAGVLEVNCD